MNDTISSANAGYVQVEGVERPFQEENGWRVVELANQAIAEIIKIHSIF